MAPKRSCDLFLERGPDRAVIGKRQYSVAHDLAAFMSLSGDQQDVALLQIRDGLTDGGATVADLDRARRRSQDGGTDRGGILAARVVVGHDHPIRLLDRNR